MKDQPTSGLNAFTHAGSACASASMRYMQNMTDLIVKENARMIEQAQNQFQGMAQAKTPALAFQLASDHMTSSANESMAFAMKAYTLGYQEQSNLLAAMQKQMSESSASWQSSLEKMPNGSFAGPSLILNAVKSALDMSQHALETTQTASQKTAELLNESLNGSGLFHQPSRETKSSRKSVEA
jgi:hypothetical protein